MTLLPSYPTNLKKLRLFLKWMRTNGKQKYYLRRKTNGKPAIFNHLDSSLSDYYKRYDEEKQMPWIIDDLKLANQAMRPDDIRDITNRNLPFRPTYSKPQKDIRMDVSEYEIKKITFRR